MYAAPNSGGMKRNNDEMEEYLLGKKNVDNLIRDKTSKETVSEDSDKGSKAKYFLPAPLRLLLLRTNDSLYQTPTPTLLEIFKQRFGKIRC